MNVLVTGGAGFIGSHVSDILIGNGHKVVVVDNLSTGRKDNVPPGVEFVESDIRSPELESVFKINKFDAVYHLAAQIDVRTSVSNPVLDADVNIKGSIHLLELSHIYSVRKFVFSSTGGAIYGEQNYFPADENHPKQPISPYGIAKLAVEYYMSFYAHTYGMDITSLRYANVYGPRQNPYGEAGVVAIFINKMLSNNQPFINGDGTQTRDYVYVEDVSRSNLNALELKGFNAINIGTGKETNVLTIFDELNRLTGNRVARSFKPQPVGEQQRSCIDYSLATKLLGWKPTVDLHQGLEKTVNFFRSQFTQVV